MWFFKPDHKQLQRLYLAGLVEKSRPPHIRPGVQPVHTAVWRELQSKSQAPSVSHTLILIHILSPSTFISRFIYQGSSSEAFSRVLCLQLLMGDATMLEDTFFHSESVPSTFSLRVFFSLPSSFRSTKLQEHFVQYSFSSETTPASVLSSLTLDQCAFPQEKWKRREHTFSLVQLLAYTIAVSD